MTSFSKIIKTVLLPFDFISGTQILKFGFWLEMMAFIHMGVYFIVLVFHYFVYNEVYDLHPGFVWLQGCGRILVFGFHPLKMYFFWKGMKEMSKKYFRAYLIVKGSLFLIAATTFTHFIVLNSHQRSFLPEVSTAQRAIIIIIGSLDLYFLFTVFYYHTKLDSPLLLQFKERLQSLESSQDFESTTDVELGCFDHDIFGEPLVAYAMFKSYIISPLDIIIDTSHTIGEGAFGIVHRGVLVQNGSNDSVVAKLARSPGVSATFDMLVKEIKILTHVGEHRNIVRFYGVTSDARLKDNFAIINGFCEMGSLDSFLTKNRNRFLDLSDISVNSGNNMGQMHENKTQEKESDKQCSNVVEPKPFSLVDLIRFSVEIADGMEHLALKKIVHGDLATRNVLLTTDLRVKITDFGMSRRLYNYQLYSQSPAEQSLMPWRWMSIEAIEDLKFSEKSDVWSYGVTLWEIFTLGDYPYDELEWSSRTLQQIRNGLRLQRPRHASSEIYQTLQKCWDFESTSRPTFSELQSTFNLIFTKKWEVSINKSS